MTGPNVTACTDRFRSTKDHAGVDIRGTRLGIDCHLDADEWQRLRADIKAGKYDDLYPDPVVNACTDSRCRVAAIPNHAHMTDGQSDGVVRMLLSTLRRSPDA